jgi:hypothetical protein
LKPWTERLGFTVTEVWVPRAELERRTETARTVDPEMTYTVEEIGVDDIVLVTSMPKFKEHGVMRFSRHGSGSVAISYTQRVDAPGQLTYWTKLLKTAKIVPPASRR